MLKIINRIPIGNKIVGLIACLLAIMLALAAYGEYVAIKSGEELEDLTQYLVPPQRSLEKISIHLLEQQVHVERTLRLVSDLRPDNARIDAELDAFNKLSARVNSEIASIETALTDTFKRVNQVEDAIALARLEAAIPIIDKERLAYEALVLETVREARQRGAGLNRPSIDELNREQRNIEELLENTQSTFSEFITNQANEVLAHERKRGRLGLQNLLVALAAFILGVLLAVVITRRMLKPIRSLIQSSNAVAQGDLSVNVEPTTQDEIGKLAVAFRDMTIGLREREAIKQTFSQYVDPRIVRHLLAPGSSDQEGDRRNMTVFFSDMAGFTTISELLTPQALVRLINAYLIEMSKPIAKENGVIDKFIGDAIMAYWGAPFVSESDHPRLAVRAGLQMFEYLDKFRLDVPEVTGLRTGAPNVDIRIGIATGPVLIGNMGSATMKSYTIMGDTVNLAARLEQACKTYSLRILISEATYLPTANDFLAREIDLIAVKGKSEAIRIFEPIAEMDLSTADHQRVVAQFAGALADYRLQKWDAAEAGFKAVLNARPGDGPSKVFLERISLLRDTPPAENWDGVWHMTEK